MWITFYSRQDLDGEISKTTYESPSYFKARLVYLLWTLCFFVNPFADKQVSLFRTENGVIFLKGKRGLSQTPTKLRKTK